MKLLLISNSTNPGEPYLDYPKYEIQNFLGISPVKAVFIPYAAVTFSYEEYERRVSERFREIGHEIISVHRFSDPVQAVTEAAAIVVGGGNTWKLLKLLRENRLLDIIRQKALAGTPFIGWSAGSNIACPTIRTTNDMPIVEPGPFASLNLVPFQINPHYLDVNPAGHAGETREQRIQEFIEVNPGIRVIGLREGSMLVINEGKMQLKGTKTARIFLQGKEPFEIGTAEDLTYLLNKPE